MDDAITVDSLVKYLPLCDDVSLLRQLSAHMSPRVRRILVWNPLTPEDVFTSLSEDSYEVRTSVATSWHTPPNTLMKMARELLPKIPFECEEDEEDADEEIFPGRNKEIEEAQHVLLNIACNKNVPLELLKTFINHPNFDLRRAATASDYCPADLVLPLISDTDWMVRSNIAQKDFLPPSAIDLLKDDDSHMVRYYIARNLLTPVEFLEYLSYDDSPMVRAGVARNPNTPHSTIQRLARDSDYWVRENVAESDNIDKGLV